MTATGRRWRLASPATAVALGVVALLSEAAQLVLEGLSHQLPTAASDIANTAAGAAFVLAFTAVGVVVARRQPRNPMGWLLIAVPLAIQAANNGSQYAYLDYTLHHGTLPLGPLAVLLTPSWEYAFVLVPLVILLFPDGRPGPRWRWPLRAYLAVVVLAVARTLSVAVAASGLRTPLDGNGNLNSPSGANAWSRPVQWLSAAAVVLLVMASIVYQARRYRRASGERRQQLKWLAAGAASLVVCFAIDAATGGSSGLLGGLAFSLGLSSLPLAMGVGILRYRLYEIDRLISRGLSYAILTALLVGTFIGLIALTTNTLALSSRVGVAASTLAAAALFNPLRKRIQHLVDRRFNRARYDAEATVAAFTARLRDAVEIDAIRADLLDVVTRAVQPTHASVWIKQTPRAGVRQ
jgi:hypothetical protein